MTILATSMHELDSRGDHEPSYELKRSAHVPAEMATQVADCEVTLTMENAARMQDLVRALWYWAHAYLLTHPDPFVPTPCWS